VLTGRTIRPVPPIYQTSALSAPLLFLSRQGLPTLWDVFEGADHRLGILSLKGLFETMWWSDGSSCVSRCLGDGAGGAGDQVRQSGAGLAVPPKNKKKKKKNRCRLFKQMSASDRLLQSSGFRYTMTGRYQPLFQTS